MRNTRVHELLPALQRAASGRRLSADAARARLAARVESRSGVIVDLCRTLVRIDGTNPPGDTTAIVEAIEGGIGVNTIPDRARALCDIRIPPGVTVERVRAELAAAIDPRPDVSWRILECTEPSWTDPEEEIVRAVRESAAAVTGGDVVVNLRAGFSDARFWRHAGVPSVVCGVAPHAMGGADEHATVEDLNTVFAVHTFAAFDYLRGH